MLKRLTVCALFAAAPAFAETPPPAPVATPAPAEAFDAADAAPVSEDELDETRGGANYLFVTETQTTQVLTAASTGNSVNGQTVDSGAISIGGDAFRGFSGIGNFVVNTGHNNVLQGSLSVQVALVPTPGS